MMLGLLGALVVGAGGYFFMFRESTATQVTQNTAPKEKVKRELTAAPDAKPKVTRVLEREEEDAPEAKEKKERDLAEDEEEAMIKKEREMFDKKKKPSKKRPPAA
jgi:hypothetical protein